MINYQKTIMTFEKKLRKNLIVNQYIMKNIEYLK